jgi:hypothetical protein
MQTKHLSAAKSLDSEVASLFDGMKVPVELLEKFLGYLHDNLVTAEKAIDADFARMTLAFLAFLVLDSGLVTEVSLAGAKLTKSGELLLMFPLVITFLNYQAAGRLGMAHEIRTAIALIYKRLCPPIYQHGLDLLTHYPSIRNFETYESKLGDGRGSRLVSMCSTTGIFMLFLLGPPAAAAFCFFRIYQSLSRSTWAFAVVASAALSLRTLLLANANRDPENLFTRRRSQ